MKRLTLLAGAVLLATLPALAQTDGTVVITPPGQPPAHVPPGGSTEGANPAPGSTGPVSPTGRAEDRSWTDPSRASNAEQPNQPMSSGGVGTGGGSRSK
jgi:hypothetical protein